MQLEEFLALAEEFVQTSMENTVSQQAALRPDICGMRIFDAPIFGFARADDSYFAQLESSGVVARPYDWLPNAKTVISFFLPFTDRVKKSNIGGTDPSPEWMHARVEGQKFIGLLCRRLREVLEQAGYPTIVPVLDPSFRADNQAFSSNWSERHIAYVCGLGTFSLSKGLITQRGMAGRFGSLVTAMEFPPTPRAYTGLDDYCTHCGACIKRCPADAIAPETGKAHQPCSNYNNAMQSKYQPYFGCGKCQAGVPCMSKIPKQS